MRAARYLSPIAGSRLRGELGCSGALLVHVPDRCFRGPLGSLGAPGSGLQAAAPTAISASAADAGARRRRRGGGRVADLELGLGGSVGSGAGPLAASGCPQLPFLPLEPHGRVGAERDVKGPVHVGHTAVLTRHYGPCYPGPDLVYLDSTIDDDGVGAGRTTGPEAGSEAGVLLPAVFGCFVSLLQLRGDAQNQAFDAEGTRKQELVATELY